MADTVLMMDIDGTEIEIQNDGTVVAIPSATPDRNNYSVLGDTPTEALRNLENISKMIRAYQEVTEYQRGEACKEEAPNE